MISRAIRSHAASLLYVAAVVDLFSRRMVGWSMSAGTTAQLVGDALLMAVWRRGKPNEQLHQSDQGSQHTSEQFQRLMADSGIVCSMSRSGNVWDNNAAQTEVRLILASMASERGASRMRLRGWRTRATDFKRLWTICRPGPASTGCPDGPR